MVNVNDFKSPDAGTQDRLEMIFARQRELMEKYHHIESKNGLLLDHNIPVDIHHRMGQARLKDMAWRTVEELCETMDAHLQGAEADHAREEIADAFHFLVEFAILSDFPLDQFDFDHDSEPDDDRLKKLFDYSDLFCRDLDKGVEFRFTLVVTRLGMTCHTLKNKPWKTSHMLTDKFLFNLRLRNVFLYFIYLAQGFGMDAQMLYDYYFRKSEVNKFRQRSDY